MMQPADYGRRTFSAQNGGKDFKYERSWNTIRPLPKWGVYASALSGKVLCRFYRVLRKADS